MLTGILPESEIQQDLFSKNHYTKTEHNLMQKVDEINTKYGSENMHIASTGLKKLADEARTFIPKIYY
ncbi:MAG: DUF4113 domain-containing protein [Fodinibius sp.]|nr:DUF4113 domain-containing protein [Fodinibius sp.]MDZ7658551.1 DUF4113 domain-containing protein [Fodinibius sp.]